MLLKTKTVRKDGMLTKTAIVPFKSIASIDFEYEVEETGTEVAEMCINFNSNCPNLRVSDKELSHMLFEIYDEEGKEADGEYSYYESTSIKDLEDNFLRSMNNYIEKTQINAYTFH